MINFESIQVINDFISILFGFCAFYFIVKYRINPRNVGLFFCIWGFVYLFEFFFLGENSFIHMDEEGNFYIPYFLYLLNDHLGGQFGHHVSGGIDIFGFSIPSIQLISPELILLSLFPVWIAYLVHLLIMFCVGFWGAYLLVRRTSDCTKSTALAISGLFTVSSEVFILASYPIGAGLTFLPIAIYAVVCRLNEKNYYRYAIPVTGAVAIYVIPTWTAEATYAGLILSAFMLKQFNIRFVVSLVSLTVFLFANWAEPLNAIAIMSAFTDRGSNYVDPAITLSKLSDAGFALVGAWNNTPINLIFAGVVALLWMKNDSIKWRSLMSFMTLNIGFIIISIIPWELVGLGPINNLSHHYMLLASTALILPLLGIAASQVNLVGGIGSRVGNRAGTAALFALAIGGLVNFKLATWVNFLYHGGQSQYHSIATLLDKSWQPTENYRVITLRVRDIGPEPEIPYGLYGLESFDAFMNMRPTSWAEYYNIGILNKPHRGEGVDPRIFVDWKNWRNGLYRGIENQMSLSHLAMANVKHILSPLPIASTLLRKVAGPINPPVTRHMFAENPGLYIKDRLTRLTQFNDMYVYEIPNAYPEVYSIDRLVSVEKETTATGVVNMIGDEFLNRGRVGVVGSDDLANLTLPQLPLKIDRYNRIKDGYEIFVDAPEGGIVAVNTYFLPFWTASADGKELKIITLNKIQMGVQVPAGVKKVIFNYHRPTVKEKLSGYLSK